MNPEAKRIVLEALESGKYLQTTGALRRNIQEVPCYCVLGLISDVSGVGRWDDDDMFCATDSMQIYNNRSWRRVYLCDHLLTADGGAPTDTFDVDSKGNPLLPDTWEELTDEQKELVAYAIGCEDTGAHPLVQEWAGLSEQDVDVLMRLNDKDKLSFEELAEHIRKM